MSRPTLLLGLLLATPVRAAPTQVDSTVRGPDRDTLSLLRLREGGTKIYVEATLPDGEVGLFLVDTGAEMSVLTEAAASRIALPFDGEQSIVGVTGMATVQMGTLPWLRLGDLTVTQLEVAVGAPGASELAGGVPLAGILGNNVWSEFVVDLDYRANTLTLHRPGTIRLPKRAVPMQFDGAHIFAPIQFTPDGDPDVVGVSWVALDTGAHDLLFRGPDGADYDGPFEEGVEPLFGVATSSDLPVSAYLHDTRRIAVDTIVAGGTTLDVDFDAVWMSWDVDDGQRSWRALAGHELFEGRRVLFDFEGQRFAILKSRKKPAYHDAREHVLDAERARHGLAPERALVRAGLQLSLGEDDAALADLAALMATTAPSLATDRDVARGLAARIHRARGELRRAGDLLDGYGPRELAEQGELIGVVNSLVLEGRTEDAADLVRKARLLVGETPEVLIAWSDAALAQGDMDAARSALLSASEQLSDPSAFVLRRARIALVSGDHDGAIAILRDAVLDNPLDGRVIWFYARVAGDTDRDILSHDIGMARSRVHRRIQPHDFLAGAMAALGDRDAALAHLQDGLARDCRQQAEPARDNCIAWYKTLAEDSLDEALSRVERALAEGGERADYLDTKAMVHLARRELEPARAAAWQAARLAPDDPYMLLQVHLLDITVEGPDPAQ